MRFSFWGKEAGCTNQFRVAGSSVFSAAGLPGSSWNQWSSTGDYAVNRGLLDFSFCVIAGRTGCVSNSDNQSTGYASYQSIGINVVDAETARLLRDDSGAGPDDNHDDMVVRVKSTSVPELETGLLFGIGLLGIGLGMRKRSLRANEGQQSHEK